MLLTQKDVLNGHFYCLQENVTLIKEINELRRELKVSRTKVHDLEVALGLDRKNRKSSLTDSKGSDLSFISYDNNGQGW